MGKQLVSVPAEVVAMSPKRDRTWKLTFATTRELSGEDVKILTDNFQGLGWCVFSPNEIGMADVPEGIADDSGKSPSQRLRAVMFVLWKQRGKKGRFDDFYATQVEELITFFKDKLEPDKE